MEWVEWERILKIISQSWAGAADQGLKITSFKLPGLNKGLKITSFPPSATDRDTKSRFCPRSRIGFDARGRVWEQLDPHPPLR